MSTEAARTGPAPGALLLCRAAPGCVAPVADLLREPMQLTPAGDAWSVLVPEGRPWRDGAEPVDRVATGWATALAVGAPWPVLALWWDTDHAGFTLASGFRRPVGFVWLASGVPVGEDEAMRTFAARMGLDPVLDGQDLDRLTAPDPAADARSRLRGLLAVLAPVGVSLPAELAPGEPAGRLREAAARRPDSLPVEWPGRREAGAERDPVGRTPLGPWMPWTGGPRARALALAQLAAGLPLLVWGLRRRGSGWATAGALLLAHGALGLTYDLTRPRD
ncbi:hypothetical protein [Streptomyces cahuitamycinicus]|uniref:Uncharacterized protein n=1 Tax=Streptomyces cahuitamycinicus TaxID=2070367 RepID=A0A2N8TFN3_9ACTN|nr:hypothetical protein [Streptomyces cahuitamycinicus]PNG17817.1 hypothetical protein C1J00_34480 [Streptomyces cahuitamycinicus]